jgi:hypothetical protein
MKAVQSIITWPLAALLAVPAAQNLHDAIRGTSEFSVSVLMLCMIGCWVIFGLTFALSRKLQPFLIVTSIPLASALISNIHFDMQIVIIMAVVVVGFILIVKQLMYPLQVVAAIAAVSLTFGLSVVGPLQEMFTARETVASTWLIALLICWAAISVPVNWIEDLVIRSRENAVRNENI